MKSFTLVLTHFDFAVLFFLSIFFWTSKRKWTYFIFLILYHSLFMIKFNKLTFPRFFFFDNVRPVGLYNLQPRSRTASLSPSLVQLRSSLIPDKRVCLDSHTFCLDRYSFRCSLPRSGFVRFAHDGHCGAAPAGLRPIRGCVSTIVFSVFTGSSVRGALAGCFGLGLPVWAVRSAVSLV